MKYDAQGNMIDAVFYDEHGQVIDQSELFT